MFYAEASHTNDPTGNGALPFHHIGVWQEREWLKERRARIYALTRRSR